MDETDERAQRLKKLASEIDAIVNEIGPKWIKLAHLRAEVSSILEEISKNEKSGR